MDCLVREAASPILTAVMSRFAFLVRAIPIQTGGDWVGRPAKQYEAKGQYDPQREVV